MLQSVDCGRLVVHADESLMAEDDRAAGAGGGAQLPLEVAEHPEASAARPDKRLRANNLKAMLLGLKNLGETRASRRSDVELAFTCA